jgi:hypothetical protein
MGVFSLCQLGGVESGQLRQCGQADQRAHQEREQVSAPGGGAGGLGVSHCKKDLRAFFYRVEARRGWGKAIVGVAHKILVIAYFILKTGTPYRDLGGDYFDKLHPERAAKRLVQQLQQLGLNVVVTPCERLTS